MNHQSQSIRASTSKEKRGWGTLEEGEGGGVGVNMLQKMTVAVGEGEEKGITL